MPPRRRHGAILTRSIVRFLGKILAIACMYGGLLLPGVSFVLAQRRQREASAATECETDGSSAHYEENLIGNGTSMARNTTSATGCPNHVNWAINPNSALYSASEEMVPAYPMLIDDADGVTDLSNSGGAVGVMFNGVALFSGWAGDSAATTYETSAIFLEGDTFDLCGGHATSDGIYHYHNTAGCLQEQAMLNAETTRRDHSPQLGWSYDGFPVYGQLGPDGVEMLMCGNTGADSTYCLDSCNGFEGTMEGVDDFMYRYYGSCGFDENFFPFTTNCYRGCCPDGIECGKYLEACGSTATAGYTSDYIPEAEERGLDSAYESILIDGLDADMIGTDNSMNCSLYLGHFGNDDATPTPSPSARTGGDRLATSAPSSATEASMQPSASFTNDPTPSPIPASGDGGRDRRTPAPSVATEGSAPVNEEISAGTENYGRAASTVVAFTVLVAVISSVVSSTSIS